MRQIALSILVLFLVFSSHRSFGQLPPYVPGNGLKGWWSFSNNAMDDSGNNNHGTINGVTATLNRFGEPNSAYSFDGINDFIKCSKAGPVGNPSMTVSFWLKSNQNTAGHILSYGANGLPGRDLRILKNGACASGIAFDTYSNQKAVSVVQDTNWHFYTITYDSTKGNRVTIASIYRDSTLLSTVCNLTSQANTNISDLFPVTFGRYHGTAQAGYLKGILDDVGIWNRVLTPAEIKKLYVGICPFSCADAIKIPSINGIISVSGNNKCGQPGGSCGGTDATVYYSYTVPEDGITELTAVVASPFSVTVGNSCGGGVCGQEVVLSCEDFNLEEGSVIYISVHSSNSDAGNFSLSVRSTLKTAIIQGVVYIDLDENGKFSGDDIGLGNIPVELVLGCPDGQIVEMTETANDGTYSFNANMSLAPGSYTVRIGDGGPEGDPSPKECCLILDNCDQTTLECELGFPPPDCDQNPYSSGNFCDEAIPLCNLEVIEKHPCSQNPSELGPWLNQAHCNGVYHNTDFYKFVAGTGSYNIKFTIFACAGAGVQYGIMEECNPGGPFIICDGNAYTGGTVTVPAESLTPCKTYIFWIDGFSGSVCSYYVEVEGDFQACELPPVTDIQIPFTCNPLCPSLDPLTIKAIGEGIEDINGVEYWWNLTGPGIQLSNLQTNDPLIDLPFSKAGRYEICLRTYHPCPGFSQPFCKEFVFENLSDPFIELKVCASDFPWEGAESETGDPILDTHGNQWKWIGGPITLAQVRSGRYDYASQLVNQCGCTYTQYLRITEATSGCKQDTCLVTIYDTIVTEVIKYIAVTDTLLIDAVLTGLPAPDNTNTIRVYPNPTMSHISIDYGDFDKMKGHKLRITSAAGTEVYRTSIEKQLDYLDLSLWQGKATYFLFIEDDTGKVIATKKIVLQ